MPRSIRMVPQHSGCLGTWLSSVLLGVEVGGPALHHNLSPNLHAVAQKHGAAILKLETRICRMSHTCPAVVPRAWSTRTARPPAVSRRRAICPAVARPAASRSAYSAARYQHKGVLAERFEQMSLLRVIQRFRSPPHVGPDTILAMIPRMT